MAEFLDLTGSIFGRLKVIKMDRKVQSGKRERYYWNCVCECGKTKSVRTDCLTSGFVKSCGCLKKEQEKINLIKNHRHKMSGTRLYGIWQKMKDRCNNPNVLCYRRYGGRGIKICEEWELPDNFLEWAIKNGYADDLQIDRIDNNGNYSPNNCRWVTIKKNCRNRRNNIKIDYEGELITVMELSEILQMSYSCLFSRYKRGLRGEDLIKSVMDNELSRAKITKKEVMLIREKYKNGSRVMELSSQYRLTCQSIKNIINYKTWKKIK